MLGYMYVICQVCHDMSGMSFVSFGAWGSSLPSGAHGRVLAEASELEFGLSSDFERCNMLACCNMLGCCNIGLQ